MSQKLLNKVLIHKQTSIDKISKKNKEENLTNHSEFELIARIDKQFQEQTEGEGNSPTSPNKKFEKNRARLAGIRSRSKHRSKVYVSGGIDLFSEGLYNTEVFDKIKH